MFLCINSFNYVDNEAKRIAFLEVLHYYYFSTPLSAPASKKVT